MNEQFKEQITYKAREFATAYTNRNFPNEPAFAFGNEGWTQFVDALVALSHPKSNLADSGVIAAPAAMPQYWSVSVNVDGSDIVSIGHNWLSGSRPLEERDEQTILGAAQHLLSFIGYGLPVSSFDPDEEAAPVDHIPEAGKMVASAHPDKGTSALPFPVRIMDQLQEIARREDSEHHGPWTDGDGEPLQDDADAAIAWIKAAAPIAPAPVAGAHWLQELERLAEKMMRDSWATGNDADWKPGMAALVAHAATPPQAAPVAQLSEPLKATLFWDDDDPEIGEGSIHEVLEREWQNGTLDIGDIKTIQQAVRLPNVRVKVVMDESADGFSFEFIEPAAMPQKTMFDDLPRPENCGTGHCSCIECPFAAAPTTPKELT